MPSKNITHLIVGPIATNCWIYPLGEKEAAIIDPGGEAEVIVQVVEKLSLVPRYILLTHGHFDHIAAVPQLAQVFAQARIAVHRLDAQYLGPDAYSVHSASIKAAIGDTSFIDGLSVVPEPDILLEEGETIGPFTVLHLPGHTPGSCAFWDKEAGALFSGDTLFRGDCGRTDLPGGNEDAIIASLRRLLTLDAAIEVYPGHGGTTTIARERR